MLLLSQLTSFFAFKSRQLQEHVLGPHHQTVLSTMDSFADACAKSGQGTAALRCYEEILERYQTTHNRDEEVTKRTGTEAILLFKMSRVHRLQSDREAELSKLEMALRAIRSIDERSMTDEERGELDRLAVLISADISRVDAELETNDMNWL